jgi:hypothetical protein
MFSYLYTSELRICHVIITIIIYLIYYFLSSDSLGQLVLLLLLLLLLYFAPFSVLTSNWLFSYLLSSTLINETN